ncbi:MAG: response regulator [Thermoflexales bacterium]|nr:response regulator [Thermoflexales bacterium]
MPKDSILIIDDDPDTIEFLRIVFTVRGRELTGAHTGTEGLRLARERRFDLILVDVMMPDIDGYEVCRRLRADPLTATIPIVILTARSSLVDQTLGLEAGADRFLIKPVGISILTGLADTLIAEHRQTEGNSA